MTYKPQYPILRKEDMLPREQIRLVSDEGLGPLVSAELKNLRRGVGYNYIIKDTPENRQNMTFRTSYFKMVAYKEGWTFDPDKYQVIFVRPNDPRLQRIIDGSSMIRTYKYRNEKGEKGFLGFESRDDQETFTRLGDRESFFLFQWLKKVFG